MKELIVTCPVCRARYDIWAMIDHCTQAHGKSLGELKDGQHSKEAE